MINLFCFWNFLKNPAWSAILALLLIISLFIKIISLGLREMCSFFMYRKVKSEILRRKKEQEDTIYIDVKSLRGRYFPYETDEKILSVFRRLYKNRNKLGLLYNRHDGSLSYKGKLEK